MPRDKRSFSSILGSLRSPSPVPEEFVRENRVILLSRARLGIRLALIVIPAYIPIDYIRLPEHFLTILSLRLGACAVLAGLMAASRTELARDRAEVIAGVVMGVLAFMIVGIGRFATRQATDPLYLAQVMALVFVIMGCALLLPVGGAAMLRLGSIPLGMHVAATLDFPLSQNLPVLLTTATALGIATVGAQTSFLLRFREYEGREAKDELLQARADFVDMLSHDIKNPLGAVNAYVEVMGDLPDLPPEARDLLVPLEAAAKNALRLATNFLQVSKIRDARLELKRKPTDVVRLLREVLAHQRCIADAKGVALREESEANLPLVDIDDDEMARVFTNLVHNAIKFSPSRGQVVVYARRQDPDRIEVVVDDSGEGLRAADQGRLFERFATLSRRRDSTGLGLFIVKTISEAHGGTVSAENRGDGVGARFRVSLPLRAAVEGGTPA